MSDTNPTVFLVDDDPSVLKALPRALEQHGFTVKACASAKEFLDAYDDHHGCLVLDLSLPEMDGLELQSELLARNINIPIIFITGHGGVTESVQAMRAGAVDFLEKPFRPEVLLQRIEEAIKKDRVVKDAESEQRAIKARFLSMTSREQDVYRLLVVGSAVPSSKEVAGILGISHRTVEHHRARILEKTLCASVSDLRTLAKQIGFVIEDPNSSTHS